MRSFVKIKPSRKFPNLHVVNEPHSLNPLYPKLNLIKQVRTSNYQKLNDKFLFFVHFATSNLHKPLLASVAEQAGVRVIWVKIP